MSAVRADQKSSYLFLRLIVVSSPNVPLYRRSARRGSCCWRIGCHLICGESTITSCNTTILGISMSAAIQLNDSLVASFTEARDAAI